MKGKMFKYRGVRILINEVNYNFKNISFNYGRTLIIYFNKGMCEKEKSLILHKLIKKYFKDRCYKDRCYEEKLKTLENYFYKKLMRFRYTNEK